MMRGTAFALAEIFGWMVVALGLGFLIGWISGGWRSRHLATRWESLARNELQERLALAARIESATDEPEDASSIEIYIDDADDPPEPSESGREDLGEVTTPVIEPSHEVIVPGNPGHGPDVDEGDDPKAVIENPEPDVDPSALLPDTGSQDAEADDASEEDGRMGPADPFEPDPG